MIIVCKTNRLVIRHLTLDDAAFMVKLLNEESFIRYIADKNVRNITDAENHLRTGPMASYKEFGYGLNIVTLKGSGKPIGICGLLKRDELQHPDLGFAFLPNYCGKGFALEAADAVLKQSINTHSLKTILAVTLPDNLSSNKLLEKVGFIRHGMVELYNSQNNLYQFTPIKNIDSNSLV